MMPVQEAKRMAEEAHRAALNAAGVEEEDAATYERIREAGGIEFDLSYADSSTSGSAAC